ncbi:ribosomal protein S18-alanine N-acetyltransferase [Maricaulis parjimensis]|uniref:ribosomal protein S18-alanine N-acetyltransferase n=1 Tax=Maricaulis parjimensis TaxID=144023 RepID=UPI00193AA29E|nr:ribosomal protein S18-alanine N-acetyltransferase [Maricaulis parjimensis]
MSLRIEQVGPASSARLAAIHATGFDRPWPANEIASLLHMPASLALAAYDGDEMGGFVLVRSAVDEAEILTIAVHPDLRRSGAGRALLDAMADVLVRTGVTRVFLEVSTANTAARALYDRAGFRQIGQRHGYYADGTDALVLEKTLQGSGQDGA